MSVGAAQRLQSARPTADAPAARIRPTAALGVIGAGVVAVIALWWQDTATVHGLGDWLSNAGRLTGLLAGYAVVVLLALMARMPALDRGMGTHRLARWHAMGGRYTVSLAVAHTLLIIWGYAVTAHTDLLSQSANLMTAYPDVLMATVAVGLLIGVGIVSARAARRRLRYETWHCLHLYTYLAIALAFSHQFSTGPDFRVNAHALVAALLLWYRLITPVRAALRHRLQVAGVRRENADIVSVYVTGRNLDRLRAAPGQFFLWRFLTRELWWAANPYSLSAPPRPDLLRLTAKICGDHSAALLQLRPGTRVIAEGPSGAFTAARRQQRKVLLLAGVGITPLRALFETLPGAPGEVILLYGTNTAANIVLRGELDTIAQQHACALPDRASAPRRQRPPVRATAATTDPRTEPIRRVLVRAARHDDRRKGKPAPGRSAARPHPRRILHPVEAAHP